MKENNDNRERDNSKRQFAQQLLDSYFTFRRNLPETGYLQENKTTLQIMDELSPMMMLSTDDVVEYMLEHDYYTTIEPDGTVSWAIWRQVSLDIGGK